MTLEEFLRKLGLALEDEDTAKALEPFGIKPDQMEGLKDLKTFATFEEVAKDENFKRELDRRLTKAAQTREEKLKEKFDFKEKEQEPNKGNKEEVDTDNPLLKSLLETVNSLKTELAAQKEEKQKETLAQKKARLTEDLKSKGIPPIYVNAFDLEKDLDEQMDTVTKQFEEEFGPINKGKKPGQKLPFPTNPGTKNEPSKEEIEAFKRKF